MIKILERLTLIIDTQQLSQYKKTKFRNAWPCRCQRSSSSSSLSLSLRNILVRFVIGCTASLARETLKAHSQELTIMQFLENILWIYYEMISVMMSQNPSTKPKPWRNQYQYRQIHFKTNTNTGKSISKSIPIPANPFQNQYQYRQIHIKTNIQDQNFKTDIGFGAYLKLGDEVLRVMFLLLRLRSTCSRFASSSVVTGSLVNLFRPSSQPEL